MKKRKIAPIILIVFMLVGFPTVYALETWVVDGAEWSEGETNGTYIEDGNLYVTPEGWGPSLVQDNDMYDTTATGETLLVTKSIDLSNRENLKFRYSGHTGPHVSGGSISPLPFAEFWINDLETGNEFATLKMEDTNDTESTVAYYDVSGYSWTTDFEFWVEINGGGDSERTEWAGVDDIEIWDWKTGEWVGLKEWGRPSKPSEITVNANIPPGDKIIFETESDGEFSYLEIDDGKNTYDIEDEFSDYNLEVEETISLYGENTNIDYFEVEPQGYEVPAVDFLVKILTLIIGFAYVGWQLKKVKGPESGIISGIYAMIGLIFIMVMWILAPHIEDIVAAMLHGFG